MGERLDEVYSKMFEFLCASLIQKLEDLFLEVLNDCITIQIFCKYCSKYNPKCKQKQNFNPLIPRFGSMQCPLHMLLIQISAQAPIPLEILEG